MLHLALVGCGNNAADYSAIATRLQHSKFTATADPDPLQARQMADSLGAKIATGGFDEMIEEHTSEFDAVLINSTPGSHADHCERAAESGKHLLVNSPIAETESAAQRIIEAARNANVCLMIGQPKRFLPSIQNIKQTLDSGKLGEPGLLRIHRWESSPSSQNLRSRVIEELDLAIWMFGRLPQVVYAVGRADSDPDYLQVHLGFSEGGMALIDISTTLPEGPGYDSFSLIGSQGAAYADDHHNMQLQYLGGAPAATLTSEGLGHVLAELHEFENAISEQRAPQASGEDGLVAIRVADAVWKSLNTSKAVQLSGGCYEIV